ncbi:MAG TPA: NACHT domain-containing protein [Thermoanaerobaculia bacterium]|nr:NACHT domain-containing protein [Thermoanaerobaculia bacterium]
MFEEGFPPTHALFYLRKPGLERAAGFPEAFLPLFVEQDAGRRRKLAALKRRIRARRHQMLVRRYGARYTRLRIDPALLPAPLSGAEREALADGAIEPAEWPALSIALREAVEVCGTIALDKAGLEVLGRQVLEDLWTAIEAELEAPGERLDDHQRERAYHERFVMDRTRLFLGRDDLVQRMVEYLDRNDDRKPLVVTGRPGGGKSALLAECVRKYRALSPQTLVVPHFIGVSPGSTFLPNTLRFVCETLRRECGVEQEVPPDPETLRRGWQSFLEQAGARRGVVLILDALNQLDPHDGSHELGWFPFQLPPGLKVIVSTLSGECLERLQRRVPEDHLIDVPVLRDADQRSLIEANLKERRKRLTEHQLTRLLDREARPDVGLPLYLLVALEELCLFGRHEAITARIERLPASVPELFDQVLSRLEDDHGQELTGSICRWLAASRSGMLEVEVLDLLGQGQELPRARWTAFYRALEFYLRPMEEERERMTAGAALLDFYHDQLRFAVYRRYLGMESPQAPPTEAFRAAHRELAAYFRGITITEDGDFPKWHLDRPRGIAELPYHQTQGEQWTELEQTLTDAGFVEAKSRSGGVDALLGDYDAAVRAWPGQEEERSSGQKRHEKTRQYVDRLIAYSRAHTARRGDPAVATPPLPSPPPAVAHTTETERTDEPRVWTPLERVQAWGHFAANHTGRLDAHDEPVFQLAYNSAASGPVADALEERLRRGEGPRRPWLRSRFRPQFFHRPLCLKTLEGHADSVLAVAVTADGRRAVSGSEDKTLRVWDLETGGSRALLGHTDSVLAVSVTPDGRQAVSGSGDNTVRLWDLETGESRVLVGHTDSVCAVAVTPDGRRAVSGSGDATMRVWELETGESRVLESGAYCLLGDERRVAAESVAHQPGAEYRCPVRAVAVSPDGHRAVLADWRLRAWDLETGDRRVLDEGHMDWLHEVSVTPDGRRAVSVGEGKLLRVWDLESGESRVLVGHTDPVVAVTSDGRCAISAWEKNLLVWELEAAEKRYSRGHELVWERGAAGSRRVLEGHTGSVRSVSLTPDGRLAVSGSKDKTLRVWDLESGCGVPEDPSLVGTVVVTPDGRRALLGGVPDVPGEAKTLRLLDLETGETYVLKGPTQQVFAVWVTPSGRSALSGSEDGGLLVWDLETGESRVLEGQLESVDAVSVTPDGRRAVSGGDKARVWDLETGVNRLLKGHEGSVYRFEVTPDGRRAIAPVFFDAVCVWDLETGEGRLLEGHTTWVEVVSVTPDGRRAVSGSKDNTLRVWDLETGQSRILEGHTASVKVVSVTPDGRRAVSGSNDNTLRVWDLETGQSRILEGHTASVIVLSVTSDGRRAISGSLDHTLRVWDLETGEVLALRVFPGRYVSSVAYHPAVVVCARGRVDVFEPLPLAGPAVVTAAHLWLAGSGHWDDTPTTACAWCGQRFPTPGAVLHTITAIARDARLSENGSPCLELPREAWDEPRLLSACPHCHQPLRLNPFVVDDRDRYPTAARAETRPPPTEPLRPLSRPWWRLWG